MKRATIRSRGIRATLAGSAAALAGMAMPAAAAGMAPAMLPAQSATIVPLLVPGLSAALVAEACPVGTMAPETLLAARSSYASKASAVLGGAESALETMRARQAGLGSLGSLIPGAAPSAVTVSEVKPLAPALAAVAPVLDCAPQAGAGLPSTIATRRAVLPGEFLASRKVAIGRTGFDASWDRVSREKPQFGREARTAITSGDRLEDRLGAVNRWVNHAIAYADDAALFAKVDYWAGPRRTLQLRKGDCEDIALLKMHMLAAGGIAREDMFLTIARDLVRRADHAVLIVRTPAGFRMLDNATDAVLDAAQANDYQPVLSFNGARSFLHGY
ncbi:MAG: transglutaminase-like cysteine peptidase [Erythrobacter sp.]|jgi:predicted transglutaminase-like cysteine proteinase